MQLNAPIITSSFCFSFLIAAPIVKSLHGNNIVEINEIYFKSQCLSYSYFHMISPHVFISTSEFYIIYTYKLFVPIKSKILMCFL